MRPGAIGNGLTGISLLLRSACPIACPLVPMGAGPSATPGADEAHAAGRPDRTPLLRPSRTASRFRLLPRLRARAASLLGPSALLLTALAFAAPAPAQTTVMLVGNTSQGLEFSRSFTRDRWQAFTTGSSPTYKLTAVDIALSQVTGNPAYTLSIETHTKAKGHFSFPGTHLVTLQNPGTLVAGLNRHTVPGTGIDLAPQYDLPAVPGVIGRFVPRITFTGWSERRAWR